MPTVVAGHTQITDVFTIRVPVASPASLRVLSEYEDQTVGEGDEFTVDFVVRLGIPKLSEDHPYEVTQQQQSTNTGGNMYSFTVNSIVPIAPQHMVNNQPVPVNEDSDPITISGTAPEAADDEEEDIVIIGTICAQQPDE